MLLLCVAVSGQARRAEQDIGALWKEVANDMATAGR
jgi:hypothetical protein